uniref:Uncharacterized protein n=1 Tax=Myotis myotis TaxID=51298 RepID=A0A7J7SC38_MYOMY|nr:hypothetical protein mMyoMyo1_009528 [Myotis myotis]
MGRVFSYGNHHPRWLPQGCPQFQGFLRRASGSHTKLKRSPFSLDEQLWASQMQAGTWIQRTGKGGCACITHPGPAEELRPGADGGGSGASWEIQRWLEQSPPPRLRVPERIGQESRLLFNASEYRGSMCQEHYPK